jgi:hypothetical protein
MAKKTIADKALALGQQQATRVLKQRDKALEQRETVLTELVQKEGLRSMAALQPEAPEPQLVQAMGSLGNSGVLVAEGDSWFDYPWADIVGLLEDQHGFDVESVAHKGDRVEAMAYSDGQLADFTRRIEKLLRRNVVPRAILLSGGGNDVAGEEFYMLLNHASSATPGLNATVVNGVIQERIKLAYISILSAVTQICQQRLNRTIPIVVHGYDYPVPDGRGFLGGWWFLPGPWLAPGFEVKGYRNLADRKKIAKDLIDRFNVMLAQVAAMPAFRHVKYVDLRGSLSSGANYKKWWDNELHPTIAGFELITKKFAAVI